MNDHLSDTDRLNMEAFFGFLLDAHKKGAFSTAATVAALASVVDTLDRQDYSGTKLIFEQGRKLILCEGTAFSIEMLRERAPSRVVTLPPAADAHSIGKAGDQDV